MGLTVVWVVALALVGLIFDGYDLVVYGAVVSTFLRDPSHLGTVTPAIAGQLAGAVHGASGIPKAWLDQLAWRDRLESAADRLFEASLD